MTADRNTNICAAITAAHHRGRVLMLCVGILLLLAMMAQTLPARAQLFCWCTCAIPAAEVTIQLIQSEHTQTKAHFGTALPLTQTPGGHSPLGTGRLGEHQLFLIRDIFQDRLLAAMMMMTEQLTAVMMQQALIIGTFFDAKHQLETQLMFQKMVAEAHKDYHPSVAMCEFGTNVRSLAAAESHASLHAFALNKAHLERQAGAVFTNAAEGPATDRSGNQFAHIAGRTGQYRNNFCDFHDMNKRPGIASTGLFFCTMPPKRDRLGAINLDIDFTRAIMLPRIINADFSDSTLEPNDHGALIAMASNLYGHDVFSRDKYLLEHESAHGVYMDARAVMAKRSVAQNSFNQLVGIKSRGTSENSNRGNQSQPTTDSSGTADYMKMILRQLGADEEWDQAAMNFPSTVEEDLSFNRYLTHRGTDFDNISYYAQMEFIAKKFYQRPEFYTNLYDKPANIQRQSVAMQAIGLMLDRDIYNSWLRSEMLLSMILEMKVIQQQSRVQASFAQFERDAPSP